MREIVTQINKLQSPCKTVMSIEEGERIAAELLKVLNNSKSGIGLAANQIGINKRVCVVNVNEPLVFINPSITKREGEINFQEGCLSFPKKSVKTTRNLYVTVEADNWEEAVTFGPTGDQTDEEAYQDALESVCIQHEIDHLDGITMYDRKFAPEPIVRGKNAPLKIGRNVKIEITNGNETKLLKWKKAEPMLSEGWTVVEESIPENVR